jgi:hypothetical protein
MPSIHGVFQDLVLPFVDSITSDMIKLWLHLRRPCGRDLVDETLWARIMIFRRRPAFISLMAQVALLSPFFLYLSTLQTIRIDGLDIHLSQATYILQMLLFPGG